MLRHLAPVFALLALAACDTGGPTPAAPAAPLVLAAGMDTIEPGRDDGLGARLDLQRLGIGQVDQVYRLTSPADAPFSFDVLSRAAGNAGSVRVSIAHAADDGVAPPGGPESIADAGCIPAATGIAGRTPWLDAYGDGFARMTMRGSVTRDQVLVFQTQSDAGVETALVEIAIGPSSRINRAARNGGNHPGVVDERTLYSSDSWWFGLPTVAVSGDRTSVIVYEGDRAAWQAQHRYELRMQYDGTAGTVTGGGSDETSIDSGHWRDHEIAALFNVLALAHSGTDAVTLKLSFDRGATFDQQLTMSPASWSTRLVQIAMAADYSLAVVFWRSTTQGTGAELVLVEGRPVAFDGGGSPTWFGFDPEQVIYGAAGDVTPLLTGMQWSEGGDLVVGHAFTTFESQPGGGWIGTTEFRCAVRPWGGEFDEKLVDREIVVGRDPSVALLGSGTDLRIFYAYEAQDGVRLRVSDDAGATFSAPALVGEAGAHTPTVFARQDGGATRVDVVYLTWGGAGSELRLTRWLDFGNSPPADYQLTTSTMVQTSSLPGGGGNQWVGAITSGYRLTQVAWLGYDAVLDGDEIVVVYDEETYDAAFCFLGAGNLALTTGGILPPNLSSPGFQPVEPPPLAPGMTLALPAPDPAHRHQLKLLRLD